MTFEERFNNALKFLQIVKQGSIFNAHYSILNFGSEEKKTHFTLCIDNLKSNFNNFRTHPLTSKYLADKRVFRLNLETDSSVKLEDHQRKISSVLLFMKRNIKYDELSKTELISHRGHLHKNKYSEILQAKRKLISSYFNKE